MLAVGVEFRRIVQVEDFAVDPHADKAGFADPCQGIFLLAAAAANQRGQDQQPRALRQRGECLFDLRFGLLPNGLAALRTGGFAQPGHQ